MSSIAGADFPTQLFEIPNLIFVVGGVIAIVAIIFGSITSIISTRAREATKREIAAYVAEGSIDPDKAVAMLKAGAEIDESECA